MNKDIRDKLIAAGRHGDLSPEEVKAKPTVKADPPKKESK